MRKTAAYTIVAIATVVALGLWAPNIGFGSPSRAWSSSPTDARLIQSVDRSHKGDRLVVPASTVEKRRQPVGSAPSPEKMLAGCEAVFSPLSASAYANFSRSCPA